MGGVTDRFRGGAQAVNRREFLGLGLGWLAFWRRGRRKLAGIRFRELRGRGAGRRYLLIHGNESTARQVLIRHMATARGKALLVEHDTRNVPFKGGLLDPNRMFSREGAERNLRMLNPGWPEAQILSGLLVLDREREEVIEVVAPRDGDVLIAAHNNGSGYSVADEVPISDRVALNDAGNPHEFCLCTAAADFERLAQGKFNVVLQDRAPSHDDGSLSRLAARAGFRYVNIEAGHGRFEKQKAMLEWVDAALPRRY
jgi:hypothetical protein